MSSSARVQAGAAVAVAAPPAVSKGRHALQGTLEDLPLPDIMQVVQSMEKTGALILKRADGARAVSVFRKGRLVLAAIDEGYETLGDRFIRTGIITRAALNDSLRYMAQFPGMRVGDALVERGFVRRAQVESACAAQLTETVSRLMGWREAAFEFRVGFVSVIAEMPNLELEFVLDNGLEPAQVLLRASLLQDEKQRSAEAGSEVRDEPEPKRREDDEVSRAIRGFDSDHRLEAEAEAEDAEVSPPVQRVLRVSEEMHTALAPGERALLLLRYASEIYARGVLLLRASGGFSLVGQFGRGLPLVSPDLRKRVYPTPPGSLLSLVMETRRPYLGGALEAGEGHLIAAPPRAAGAVTVLCVPLVVLGKVGLVLGCSQPIGGSQDVRALIAVARHAAVMFENHVLKRRGGPRSDPSREDR